MLGLATRCSIRMYDVVKCSIVLENVAGFRRPDAYICGPITNDSIRVGLHIGEMNFLFPQMLYESECHQR